MKNAKQILGIAVLGLALSGFTSCKNDKGTTENTAPTVAPTVEHKEMAMEQSQPKFKDELVGATFQHYIHLKSALVKSDNAEAKSGAKMMAETTTDESLKVLAVKISEENEIKIQRELFSDLTTALKPIIAGNIISGEIYEQNCPMALKGGANWFAVEKQINNPYYGDKMLHCGLVQETLK
ncbi:DUF3347 domain-containing protein [Formosa undariae]|uniref:DUF3347 domain-containing protein n=1 Tax=Formosa undariae TaxID=1325436 RepID=A0ABV5F480_9FLAO